MMPPDAHRPNGSLRFFQRQNSPHSNGDSCRQVWPSHFTGERPAVPSLLANANAPNLPSPPQSFYIDRTTALPRQATVAQTAVFSRCAVSAASCISYAGNRYVTRTHCTDPTAVSTRTAGVPSSRPGTRSPGWYCWPPDELTEAATDMWRAILRRPEG